MINNEGNNVREVSAGCFTIVMLAVVFLCAMGIYMIIKAA